MKVVDLRSDTLTTPTEEMLQYMIKAKVGDDGRANGLKGEDPTTIELERLAAEKFGKEDALFVPSGSMGNMVCLLASANRGDSIVVAQNTHLYKAEKGNFDKDLCGFIPEFVSQTKGVYDLVELENRLKFKKIALVCIENTYNFEGGTVISKEQMKSITDLCSKYRVPVHLDGARIFNASSALGVDVKELTQGVNSIMFCISKGLCAPIGSVVVGSTEFIKKTRAKRKLVGGQLRQAGIIAAAGIVSIEKMTDRLKDDYIRAKKLAEGISPIPGLVIDMGSVQTNIVKVDLSFNNLSADQFLKGLSDKYSVKGHLISEKSIRLVTYNGISEDDIIEAIKRIKLYCEELNG